jgi:hypothetical protein
MVAFKYVYIFNTHIYYIIYIEGVYAAVACVGVFAGHLMLMFGTTTGHPSTRILTTFSNTVMCTAAVADAFWLRWTGFKLSRESFKIYKAEDICRGRLFTCQITASLRKVCSSSDLALAMSRMQTATGRHLGLPSGTRGPMQSLLCWFSVIRLISIDQVWPCCLPHSLRAGLWLAICVARNVYRNYCTSTFWT